MPLWTYQNKTQSSPLKEMKDYWHSLRAGRMVPLRSEVDPREIAGSLECGFIVERTQPGSVRFRLAGSHLSDLMGMEIRGMPIRSFIKTTERASFDQQIERVFQGPEAHEYRLISDTEFGAPLTATLIMLPLKSETGEIDRAVGCLLTQGFVGQGPRRFRVQDVSITDLRLDTTQQHIQMPNAGTSLGLAETATQFQPAPLNDLSGPQKHPHLRLVTSDE